MAWIKGFSIVLVSVLLVSGCELFETRKPEEPTGNVEWNYFPITSEQAWDNLTFVFKYDENIDKYGTILTDDFRFYFDAQDVHDYSLPPSWNKHSEVTMRGLITISVSIDYQPIVDKEDLIQADKATYNRDYEIRKGSTDDILFAGSMSVYLRRDVDGFWRIYRWEDYRKGQYVSWGRLKYEYGT